MVRWYTQRLIFMVTRLISWIPNQYSDLRFDLHCAVNDVLLKEMKKTMDSGEQSGEG